MKEFEILKELFRKYEEVSFAFLFGSKSKGLDRNLSDYDIGIYFKPENSKFIEFEEDKHYPLTDKIWADLELLLKKDVDVVVLNRASVSIAADIITKGIPIIIKNRDVFLRFLVVVTSWAIDRREFVRDYFEIFQRSKSMTEQDKENIRKILIFLQNEIKDYNWAKNITWEEYREDGHKRRDLERWIENIMNSIIDISKILLSSHGASLPETYRETILNLKIFQRFNDQDIERLSQWAKLRNILAHQYLDIKWEYIKDFAKESHENIKNFIEAVKAFIA